MIQCPICQVLNEDGALFCAECGQRFGGQGGPPQQGQAPQHTPSQLDTLPPDSPEPKQKSVKLRSPILGGGDGEEDQGYEKPQMGKLRGTGSSTGPRKHLRSPLLGGDDEDLDEDEQENARGPRGKSRPESQESTGARKKKLRSPLLGEDDDDDGEDFAPESSSKGGGKRSLRSPLLGADDDDDDAPRPAKKGLRSPMLGSDGPSEPHHAGPRHKGGLHSPLLGDSGYDDDDDDDDDEPVRPKRGSAGTTTGGKPKLRSSLLGGGYDDDLDDEWDEDDDDDDDNSEVLRSPLLAAKKKKKPKPAPSHGQEQHGPEALMHPQQHQSMPQPPQMQPPQPQPPQMQPHPQQGHQGLAQGAPFPGPPEPQPPWQGGGAPPIPGAPTASAPAPQGWPQGAQPQPGQPWPPQGQPAPTMQAAPVQGPAGGPPLPAEHSPGAPPWQNRMASPAPQGLDLNQLKTAGAAEVPPIVDDNDEFQLDIPAPSSMTMSPPAPPKLVPEPATRSISHSESRSLKRADDERQAEPSEEDSEFSGPRDRRQRVERRKNVDRRFTSLLDDKGSSPSSLDSDDDFSIGRPQQAGANAGLAKMMLGLGAMALGFKIYEFIKVAGMWDLSKLPEFVAEQFFSGLAIVGLIVLALSCMKK